MTADALHPLLAGRYSPLQFDRGHELTDADVELLLEAARWAPSAGNSQPWSFVVARRGTAAHARLVERLAPSSRQWAPSAGVLIVNLAHRYVEDTDWDYSEFAEYDLGQAVAHLTVQAHAMGLACRQFRAFDLDGLRADLRPADGWRILTMTAVGRPVGAAPPARTRRSITDLTTAGVDS
ncbi:nitroreductase family protein [Actinocatenispora rupis]|uniref:Nitroreductase domain-containing protein n=1 Tax=Actinocatenispora rupis TaxID=519421 RepID=A0A8J3NDW5_9ACTN|nr:nitroreductase family protein [Actinocatenispora rupis]GID15441.1 hypothetical protein Aru02nite_63300 [Actinocatenispora rupis]